MVRTMGRSNRKVMDSPRAFSVTSLRPIPVFSEFSSLDFGPSVYVEEYRSFGEGSQWFDRLAERTGDDLGPQHGST